ncbi:hypothetical protein DCC62_14595 [candidate division KSB1 bacterium]|nr:MAG: hypothetical protein DCC62_14595 [candidate division KSB1 bacterium]
MMANNRRIYNLLTTKLTVLHLSSSTVLVTLIHAQNSFYNLNTLFSPQTKPMRNVAKILFLQWLYFCFQGMVYFFLQIE